MGPAKLCQLLFVVALMTTGMQSQNTCPSYCECYDTRTQMVVDCSIKRLATIPNYLPRNVTTLRLGYNNITEVFNSTLANKGLRHLQRLELNDNLIFNIESGAFDAVPQLTKLDLENNQLRYLHPDTFSSLSRLWKLMLNGNPLELPENGPFLVAPDLQVLELERCGIEHLPPHTFQNLSGLLTLRLTSNFLTSVNLQGSNLIHIGIGSNFLTENNLVLDVPSLIALDISHSGFTLLPENVMHTIPNLQRLKLEYNFIRALDVDVLAKIPQLTFLNMSANLITNLHTDTFHANRLLTHLDLSSNPIVLPADGGFISSPSIRFLSLASCNLTDLAGETFRNLPNLTHLVLSNNRLWSVRNEMFSSLTNLESLHLDGNRIYTLAQNFPTEFLRLVSLNLSRNRIRIPSSPFLESNSLKELLLDECGFDSLQPLMFRLMPNLTTVSLSGNELTYIDVQTFQVVPDLHVLNIDGNPLICDCSLVPLWQWCSSRQCENSIVRCQSPRGRTWRVLDDLVCESGVTEINDNDIDLEVEMVDIPQRNRRPPERLTA